MKLRAMLTVMTAVVALVACARSKEPGNYVNVEDNDKEMNAAIAKAKESSGDFLRAFRAQEADTKGYFVKKPFGTPTGGKEHMWVEVRGESNGVLSGVVANEAEETREVKNGDGVSVNITEISDWQYQRGKKLIGGYTIRYFAAKMSPEERAAFLREAGFEL